VNNSIKRKNHSVSLINIIDKKDKVKNIVALLEEYLSDKEQIESILQLIDISNTGDNEKIFNFFQPYSTNQLVIE
jgi:tetrahydromethanopterin S-methyltransferase subunit A